MTTEDGWQEVGVVGPSESVKEYRMALEHSLVTDELLRPAIRALMPPSPFLDDEIFGKYVPPTYTRRQRIGRKIHAARERLALRLAPWLDREDEW